ncbi:hypothetical protein SRHO_G00101350 [Serrasalmus rhombeus]
MEHLTTGIMEFSSYLLLLLVALSVSAVQEERHSLYHNYSSHSNNRIVKATVQFDGVEVYCFIQKTTDTWTSSPWGIRMMDVDYTFRNYSKKLYHHLKGVLSKETDSDLTQRFGCEAERSSSGAVTLLSSTAEFRLNGKIVLRFNADRDQWEALDKRQEEDKEEEKRIRVFSVLSCILIACIAVASVLVKKIRKCNIVRPPAEDAYRGYSREMENEDHAGGDPDQTETEDDGGGQNLGQFSPHAASNFCFNHKTSLHCKSSFLKSDPVNDWFHPVLLPSSASATKSCGTLSDNVVSKFCLPDKILWNCKYSMVFYTMYERFV